MIRLNRNRCFAYLFVASLAQSVSAQTMIFEAEKQCTLASSSTGNKFTTPCQASNLELPKPPLSELNDGSELRDLRHLLHVEINFACRSLRPTKISWSVVGNSGEIAPGTPFVATFPTDYDAGSLSLSPKLGTESIQAFYPACVAELTSYFLAPDPKAASLALKAFAQLDKSLGASFEALTPGAETQILLHTLAQSLDIIDILEISAGEDDFSKDQIISLREKVSELSKQLSNTCLAGSQAELCTAKVAEGREAISALREDLKSDYLSLQDYVEAEAARLLQIGDKSSLSVGEELKKLLQ